MFSIKIKKIDLNKKKSDLNQINPIFLFKNIIFGYPSFIKTLVFTSLLGSYMVFFKKDL